MPTIVTEKLLNAILIDPFTQTISTVQVANRFVGENGMYEHMKCRLIEHYPIDIPTGDIILCDEESLLQYPLPPAFEFGGFIIHGIALIIGDNPPEYTHTKLTLNIVQKVVRFCDSE